jgi:hypothetical protein
MEAIKQINEESNDLPKDIQELYGVFGETYTPDKKELRKMFHERVGFDYTEWQREYFSDIPLDEFLYNAQAYDQNNPFTVN